MFSALAAVHWAWLNLFPPPLGRARGGRVPPLAFVTNWLSIASNRPNSAAVFGGIPLAARMSSWVALVRPCCSAEASAAATACCSAACAWAAETVMPAWRATSS